MAKTVIFIMHFLLCYQTVIGCYVEPQLKNSSLDSWNYYDYAMDEYHYNAEGSKVTYICSNIYGIKDIYHLSEDMEYAYGLKIVDSKILTLYENDFDSLEHLQELHINGSYLQTIMPGAFSSVSGIKILYLPNNNLTEINIAVFSQLKDLEILDLSNNRIKIISNLAFYYLFKLRELYLQDNLISHCDFLNFFGHYSFNVLDLSRNPLESNFTFLKTTTHTLKLDRANLTSFRQENFGNVLTLISNISLNQNFISTVNFSAYPIVYSLSLKQNQIEKIVGKMNTLEDLNLSYNRIKLLEADFLKTYSLKHLNLSYNQISFINGKAFNTTRLLETITLSNNNISTIEVETFFYLKKLIYLDLSHNLIKIIPFGTFDNLNSLHVLDISYNRLKSFNQHVLDSLNQLVFLKMDYNNITNFNIDILIKHLPHLIQISLDGNHWECEILSHIISTLKLNKVKIVEGSNFGVENKNGIACKHLNNNANNNLSSSIQELKIMINETMKKSFEANYKQELNSSKLYNFFDQMNTTKFLELWKQFQNSSKRDCNLIASPSTQHEKSSDKFQIIILIFQVAMCLLLVALCIIALFYIKGFKTKYVKMSEDTLL